MEHRFTRISLTIVLLSAANLLAGCKRPLDKPELSDTIYLEHVDAAQKIQKNLNDEVTALKKTNEDLKKPDLTSGEKRQLLKEQASEERKIRAMEQDVRFYEIRTKSRLKYVYEVYPGRFEKDLPWPDPEELQEYEAHKKLQFASKNWADRVPKLKYGPKKTSEKAEEPQKPSEE